MISKSVNKLVIGIVCRPFLDVKAFSQVFRKEEDNDREMSLCKSFWQMAQIVSLVDWVFILHKTLKGAPR